jgi:hypothetical protein
MLKKGTIPVVDEYFIRAIKNALDQIGINPDNLPQKKRRTNLDGIGYGADNSYNGYFTIKIQKDADGKAEKIIVCDGATYDDKKNTSGTSKAEVNGVSFLVPFFSDDVPNTSSIVYLLFTPFIADGENNIGQDKVEIKIGPETELNQDGKATYLIGEIVVSGGDVKVIQKHGIYNVYGSDEYVSVNNVARFKYYYECVE